MKYCRTAALASAIVPLFAFAIDSADARAAAGCSPSVVRDGRPVEWVGFEHLQRISLDPGTYAVVAKLASEGDDAQVSGSISYRSVTRLVKVQLLQGTVRRGTYFDTTIYIMCRDKVCGKITFDLGGATIRGKQTIEFPTHVSARFGPRGLIVIASANHSIGPHHSMDIYRIRDSGHASLACQF